MGALASIAHLFWPSHNLFRDAKLAMRCLQSALRYGECAVQLDSAHVVVIIEVLDHAIHLFDLNCTEFTAAFLSRLVALCVQHLNYIEGKVPADAYRALSTSLAMLAVKKKEDRRYSKVNLSS